MTHNFSISVTLINPILTLLPVTKGSLQFELHKPIGDLSGYSTIGVLLTGHGRPTLFSYMVNLDIELSLKDVDIVKG
ncbi:MAG: hypothetical protein V1758_01875 [Pseudomonadota bacterium]